MIDDEDDFEDADIEGDDYTYAMTWNHYNPFDFECQDEYFIDEDRPY